MRRNRRVVGTDTTDRQPAGLQAERVLTSEPITASFSANCHRRPGNLQQLKRATQRSKAAAENLQPKDSNSRRRRKAFRSSPSTTTTTRAGGMICWALPFQPDDTSSCECADAAHLRSGWVTHEKSSECVCVIRKSPKRIRIPEWQPNSLLSVSEAAKWVSDRSQSGAAHVKNGCCCYLGQVRRISVARRLLNKPFHGAGLS